jgi:chaperone required for assembly of F1-ATPase
VRRFYKTVTVGDGNAILLDNRPVKTPAGAALALPTRTLAEAVAEEWRGQGDAVDTATMPLTKLSNTALDRATALRTDIVGELAGFGGSDLLCYYADEPGTLIARQREHWTPLLDWAQQTHGARLKTAHGITHVAQDAEALAALRRALETLDDWTLTGLQTLTTITGSLVLALAVAAGRLTPAQAFTLSRLDETFQAEKWGEDEDAQKRAAALLHEMEVAGRFISLSSPSPPRSGGEGGVRGC